MKTWNLKWRIFDTIRLFLVHPKITIFFHFIIQSTFIDRVHRFFVIVFIIRFTYYQISDDRM